MSEAKLTISIPTFNRSQELKELLASLIRALEFSSVAERKNTEILIFDNSTIDFKTYVNLINKYQLKFDKLGIKKFSYKRTGFNIGGINNCTAAILNAKGDYVWFLPDDDIVAIDSISTIHKAIYFHNPCFIH